MKKVISCLLLIALCLSSLLVMIPASAAATETNLMGNSEAAKQWKGVGNVFYYDYWKYVDVVKGGTFVELKGSDQGASTHMLRFDTNNGNGSASVCDGEKTSGTFWHGIGTGMTINEVEYSHVFGYSFKESVIADGIKFYLPLTDSVDNDASYSCPITEIDVYGASIDRTNGIYGKESEKTLLASFKNVNTTALTTIGEKQVIYLEADTFTEALKIDYIFFALQTSGKYRFYEIELNGIKASASDVTDDFNNNALKAQYAILNDLVKAEYTDDSWAGITSALATTDPINQNASATAAEISAAADTLEDAINTLVVNPDLADEVAAEKEALATAINTAKEKVETAYTPATWAPFKVALTNAEAALANDNIAPTPVKNITKALNDAMSALKARPVTTALDAKLAEAAALKEADYTANSWKALQDAIKAVTDIKNNVNSTQDDIDTAVTTLETAIGALAKPGNKDELKAEVEKAKALKQEDFEGVTALSWSLLEMEIEDAEAIIADANATQADINSALNELKAQIANLVPKAGNAGSTNNDGDGEGDGSEAATDATTEATEQTPETDAPAKGGCGSSVAISAIAIVGVISTAVALKKRED